MAAAVPKLLRGPSPFPRAPAPLRHIQSHGTKYSKTCCSAAGPSEAPSRGNPAFVDYLHALYAGKPPELIVAIGAPAANFVQRYRERIFPGTPMLFTGVEARRVQHDKLTRDDTVVAPAHDFPASFEHILRVLPRTKMIAVVNGASPNENF